MRQQTETTHCKRRAIVQWRNPDGTKGFASKTFAAGTLVRTIDNWIASTKRAHQAAKPLDGSLGADVEHHLTKPEFAKQPSYAQRACYLRLWLDALGRDRVRQSVTTPAIDAVVAHWRVTPTTRPFGRACPDGVGDGTLIKRLMYLKLFYNDVNEPHEPNPVVAAAWPDKPKEKRRDRDYGVIERIIAAMPMHGPSKQRGQPPPISLGRIRVRVLAYTGLPPGMLTEIGADAIDWRTREWITPEREKGDRVESRRVPLSDDAFAALGDLRDAGGFGSFDVGSLNRMYQRAAHKVGLRNTSLYDLRHSFGTEAYRLTGDRATVARLMLHAKNSPTTDRYIVGATDAVDRKAIKQFSKALIKKRRGALHVAPVQKRKAS